MGSVTSAYDTAFSTSARTTLLARFGESVTHTTVSGTATSCTVLRRDLPDDRGRRRRAYTFSTGDISSSDLNDTITDGSEVWFVDEIGDVVGGTFEVSASISQEHS